MKKYYTFAMVLYKDSTSYNYKEIIKYIEKNFKYYAYIEHKAEGEKTKKHTHVLMHFDNKRYVTGVAKELGIASNYIINVNFVPYLRYLIHFDDEDKIQYNIDDVKGTLTARLRELISTTKKTETEQVATIMSFIFEFQGWLTISCLSQYVLQVGCYSAFRRNYGFFKDLVLDHNTKF